MAFTTKLFRIVVSNSYYKSNAIQNDFNIQPIRSTACWMAERKVRILDHPDGIELIWLSQGYDDPLALLKKKADGITLSFVMTLKNSQALNLAQLETGYSNGQVYYLYNGHASNNHLLHSKAFMSESDLMKIQDVPHYPTEPGWNVFAMIDIDLTHCIHALSKQKNSLFAQPVTYRIKIQNRSTFWRYYLVDTKKRLSGSLTILSNGDDSYFSQVKPSTKFRDTYCAESTMPMELCDQYDRSFSLCVFDKNSPKGETILLEKLPYPTYDSLKKDGTGKKKLYSDIVVYV
ncbi:MULTISPECIES: hypothetical protein [Candidatus Cardinium]|uniref:hypothetical protein n=1 Tax=Candidatus Cardinium TaxID=273135 RepID=UPI001FAA91B4|nr:MULTISPECIES: hypothetical protein [Cardinium]